MPRVGSAAQPVDQALVAIGGRARRLRAGQVRVGASKSFMVSGRRCLLYWCLKSLHVAGIRRLVLAGNEEDHLRKAERILSRAHFEFDEVALFQDAGLGVHGLPVQAERLLDATVLFEAGHGISHPNHYRSMIAHKTADNVVFSAFPADPANPRFRVRVEPGGRCARPAPDAAEYALAHPMLIDRRYLRLLTEHDFTVNRVADHYLARGALTAVPSALPVEFDLFTEYGRAMTHYRSGLALDPLGERPWLVPRPERHKARVEAVDPGRSPVVLPADPVDPPVGVG